jgi:UDP-N-acetylglucosamine acyltransferase
VNQIHPSAIVSQDAKLGRNVSIGPFCVIESNVAIGNECRLAGFVVIREGTTLGAGNVFHERVVVGGEPQYVNAQPPFGGVRIGDRNVFRECTTIHRGLKPGQLTTLGDGNYLMVNAHIAHDCVLGSHNIVANNAMLGGHVLVGSHAYISASVAIHQFCRVGDYAMVGGQSHVNKDVPPFVTLDGLTSRVVGLNTIGLKRKGFSPTDIAQLKEAYRVIYRRGLRWDEVLATLAEQFGAGPAAAFLEFFQGGRRGFMPERRTPRAAALRIPQEPLMEDEAQPLRKAG